MTKTSESFLFPTNLQQVTRRDMITAALVTLSTCVLPARARADAPGRPPKLEDSTVQFTALEPAKPMPSIALRRLNDKPVDLLPKPGRALLVNFWATWSEPCETELPTLDGLQQAFGKDLDIAAIAHDGGGRMVVEPFLHKKSIKHLPIYLDPDGVATGIASTTRQAGPFVLYGTPVSYLIAPNGLIAGYIPGAVNWGSESAHELLRYFMQVA